jgi:hypothetical protein
MTISVVSTGLQPLLDLVYGITGRPDLVSETKLALRKATIKFHEKDFWLQDKKQVPVVVSATGLTGRYTIDLSDGVAIPRFRAAYGLRQRNTDGTLGITFTALTEDEIFDHYKVEKTDYFYRVGMALNIKSCRALSSAILSYYQFPNVQEATYSSWIATTYPEYIAEEAAAAVFKIIGKDDEAKIHRDLFEENIAAIRISAIESVVS